MRLQKNIHLEPSKLDEQAPISSTDKCLPAIVQQDGTVVEFTPPCKLTTEEIPDVVNDYRLAARNAIGAEFDGVEIHGAHSYLIEQFMKDSANGRTDWYGGSLENHCRFTLEVVKAVTEEIGADRLFPYPDFMGFWDSNPEALGLYMMESLNKYRILYRWKMPDSSPATTEPRMAIADGRCQIPHRLLPMRKLFKGTFIATGGYNS